MNPKSDTARNFYVDDASLVYNGGFLLGSGIAFPEDGRIKSLLDWCYVGVESNPNRCWEELGKKTLNMIVQYFPRYRPRTIFVCEQPGRMIQKLVGKEPYSNKPLVRTFKYRIQLLSRKDRDNGKKEDYRLKQEVGKLVLKELSKSKIDKLMSDEKRYKYV
jgi:hypothetical protein